MYSHFFQLYMIPEIRSGVLSADVGYSEDDEAEENDEKGIKEVCFIKQKYFFPNLIHVSTL